MATTESLLAKALLVALAMQLLPLLVARHTRFMLHSFTPAAHSYGDSHATINNYGLVHPRPVSASSSFDNSSLLPDSAAHELPCLDSSPDAPLAAQHGTAPTSHEQSIGFPDVESAPADFYDSHRPTHDAYRSYATRSPSLHVNWPSFDENNPHDTSAEHVTSSRGSYGSYREGTVTVEDVPSSANHDAPSDPWLPFDSSRWYGHDVPPYEHDLSTAGSGN